MEARENKSKRQFPTLSNPEKITAILGAVMGPVTRDQALEFSGIEYDGLTTAAKEELDSAFRNPEIEQTQTDDGTTYILSSEGRDKLEQSVDLTSAEKAIADFYSRLEGNPDDAS